MTSSARTTAESRAGEVPLPRLQKRRTHRLNVRLQQRATTMMTIRMKTKRRPSSRSPCFFSHLLWHTNRRVHQ